MFGRNFDAEKLVARAMKLIGKDESLPTDLCVELDAAGIDINDLYTPEWHAAFIDYQRELGLNVIQIH